MSKGILKAKYLHLVRVFMAFLSGHNPTPRLRRRVEGKTAVRELVKVVISESCFVI